MFYRLTDVRFFIKKWIHSFNFKRTGSYSSNNYRLWTNLRLSRHLFQTLLDNLFKQITFQLFFLVLCLFLNKRFLICNKSKIMACIDFIKLSICLNRFFEIFYSFFSHWHLQTKLAKVINLSVFHFRTDFFLQNFLDLVIISISWLNVDLRDV